MVLGGRNTFHTMAPHTILLFFLIFDTWSNHLGNCNHVNKSDILDKRYLKHEYKTIAFLLTTHKQYLLFDLHKSMKRKQTDMAAS